MAMYTITLQQIDGPIIHAARRRRIDGAIFAAHAMLYDFCEGRGLRDSRAAWNILRKLYATNYSASAEIAGHRIAIVRH